MQCFAESYFYSLYSRVNVIDVLVQSKFKKRFQCQFHQNVYKVCYWVVIRGSGREDLEDLRVMFVLLDGGIYCTLTMLWILIFVFYMILCSCQRIYLNHCSVVRFSFDPHFSILYKW